MRGVFLLFAVSVGALFAVASSGCAAGSSPTDPKPAPKPATTQQAAKTGLTTVAEFCQARASAECSDAVVAACGFASGTSCQTKHTKSCMTTIPQGTKYQPAKAPACLALVAKAFATNQVTAAALASLNPACGSNLFAGPGEARAPCMTDYDCDSAKRLSCVFPNPPSTGNMGQCFVPQIIQPGGDCSGQGTVCGTNTYCDPTAFTCVTDNQLGESCNAPDYPCAAGLSCPGSGFFGATCAAGSADGTACNSSTECGSGLCDKAANQSGGTCATTVTLSSLDALCQSSTL